MSIVVMKLLQSDREFLVGAVVLELVNGRFRFGEPKLLSRANRRKILLHFVSRRVRQRSASGKCGEDGWGNLENEKLDIGDR